MHGYDFISEQGNEDCIDHSRPFAWSKLKLIQKHMDKYDIVVWIDADTYIMNPNIQLKDIYEKFMPIEKDLMMASDWKQLNTGVLFVRPTAFMHGLIDAIYSVPNYAEFPDYEQGVFVDLFQKDVMISKNETRLGTCKEKACVLPVQHQRAFNAYWFNYIPGDFILHFPGCKMQNLPEPMGKYCPIKKDDETYDTFVNRVNWIFTRSRSESDHVLRDFKQKEKEGKL